MRLILVWIVTIFFECAFAQLNSKVDYQDEVNWAVLPSDTIKPWSPFVETTPFKNVDVFYVYPTLLIDSNDFRWNYDIQDPNHKEGVVNYLVKYQASAWADLGRVYVPFYRQAHFRSFINLEAGGEAALRMAYEDVKASFQFYLKYYNKGNAIMLAGHSQGSFHLKMLLKDFFDGQPLQEKLIAAYLPGIGIDKDLFKTIYLMIEPNATGGFLTWNTLKKEFQTDRYEKWYRSKAVVNPITWDLSSYAPKSAHKGFLFTNNKLYKKVFETHLIDGAIYIDRIKFPLGFLGRKMLNYHSGDVNLFWGNIRENARLRTINYFQKNIKTEISK
tara:strand:+ start:727 stop:1716 length:990 start_codon:yes stop_codon:yes gene_type:complete